MRRLCGGSGAELKPGVQGRNLRKVKRPKRAGLTASLKGRDREAGKEKLANGFKIEGKEWMLQRLQVQDFGTPNLLKNNTTGDIQP